MIREPRQHVGEPNLRIDVVELSGLDRIDRGRAAATFIGTGEGVVLAPHGNLAVILPISGRML